MIGKDTFKGMGIDFADINNDGIFDMYVSNIASPFRLQESHFLWVSTGHMDRMKQGQAPWVDKAEDMHVAHSAWAWDVRFEDFDNDGAMELVQATGLVRGRENRWADLAQVGAANDRLVRYPSLLAEIPARRYRRRWHIPQTVLGARRRRKICGPFRLLFPDLTAPTRGIAVADVDGDGYPDMVYANYWQDSVLIKNHATGNQFLALHLMLPTAQDATAPAGIRVHDGHPAWREGTPAIGTFVEIETPDGHKQIRQVDGGNGHSGQRSPEVRFGLGQTASGPHPGATHLARLARPAPSRCAFARARLSHCPARGERSGTNDERHRTRHHHSATSRPAPPKKKPNPRMGLRTSATFATIFTILGHTVFGFEQSWAQVVVALISGHSCALLFEWVDARANHRTPEFAGGGWRKLSISCWLRT